MNIYEGLKNLHLEGPNPMDSWVADVHSYGKFQERVKKEELKNLPPADRQFLLAYATKRGILHSAVKENDVTFLKALLDAGADINALDANGSSLLAIAEKPEVFAFLRERKAQFLSTDENHCLLKQMIFLIKWKGDKSDETYWLKVFSEVLLESTPEDLMKLNHENLFEIAWITLKNPQLYDPIIQVLINLQKKNVAVAVHIGEILLGEFMPLDFKISQPFFFAVQKGIIGNLLLEELFKNPKILRARLDDKKFFSTLVQTWKLSEKLLPFMPTNDDFCLALFCYGLFHASSVDAAGRIFTRIHLFEKTLSQIKPKVQQECLDKVVQLQKKEKKTIWEALSRYYVGHQETFVLMEQFGLDPNWTDATYNRNYLFTNLAETLPIDSIKKKICKVNLAHLDSKGNNALDHHCYPRYQDGKKMSDEVIKNLTEVGLRLSDRFPNIEKLRTTFPEYPHLQAYLGRCLLFPRMPILSEILDSLPTIEQSFFLDSIKKDEALYKVLGELIEQREDKDKKKEDQDMSQWESKFPEEYLEKIKKFQQEHCFTNLHLDDLSTLWEGKILPEELKTIPNSFWGSFILACIKKQYEKKSKSLEASQFFATFSHNDLVLFTQYLFVHPEYMEMCVHSFMTLEQLDLFPGKGSKTGCGNFIASLLRNMKDLLHVPKYKHNLDKNQRDLISVIDEEVVPTFKERLSINPEHPSTLIKRTLVVKTPEGLDFFKVADQKRWKRINREYRISKFFHESTHFKFRSQLLKPQGLHVVQNLPPLLKSLSKEGKGPLVVFHYRNIPDSLKGIEELRGEEFMEASNKCLTDAGKMIRLGMLPNWSSLHPKDEGSKSHLFLLHLLLTVTDKGLYHSHTTLKSICQAKIDPKFASKQTTDLRKSGLVCFGKADHFWNTNYVNYHDEKIYVIMANLSRIYLMNIMHVANPYLRLGKLNWNDQKLMFNFGLCMAGAFAMITEGYADKAYKDCYRFVQGCGINWTRAATQFAFWVDEGPNGYQQWIKANKLPPGLYEEGVQTYINAENSLEFLKNMDRSPTVLTELEKAMHLFFFTILWAEPLEPPAKEKEEHQFYGFFGDW